MNPEQLALFNVIDGHPMTAPSGALAPCDRVVEVMPEYQPPVAPQPATRVMTSWGVPGRIVGCGIGKILSLVELEYFDNPRRLFVTESLTVYD